MKFESVLDFKKISDKLIKLIQENKMSKNKKFFYIGLFFIVAGIVFNIYLSMMEKENLKSFNNMYKNIEILPGVKTQKAVSEKWLKSDKVLLIKDIEKSKAIFDRELFNYFYNNHKNVMKLFNNNDNTNYKMLSYDNLAYILLDEGNKPVTVFARFDGAEGVYESLNKYLEEKRKYILENTDNLMLMHSIFDEKSEREKYIEFIKGFAATFDKNKNVLIYIGSYIEGNKVNPWETKYVSEKGGIVLKHFFKYYLIYIGLFLIYISIVTRKKRSGYD
tara:strand:+ start:652 stop:1479 length:828 start_codon:yes stop_codon:yes gene_type:complete